MQTTQRIAAILKERIPELNAPSAPGAPDVMLIEESFDIDSMDDAIQIELNGISIEVQIGAGYASVNQLFYDENGGVSIAFGECISTEMRGIDDIADDIETGIRALWEKAENEKSESQSPAP